MQDSRTVPISAYRIAQRRAERRKRIRRRRIVNAIVFVLLAISLATAITLIAKENTGNEITQCTPLDSGANQKELTLSKKDDCNEAQVVQTVLAADTSEIKAYTERDVELIAKTVYGEALVTQSDTEMAAVVWCILNRVDAQGYGCGNNIEYVVTFKRQFHGYNETNPVTPHIKELVIDVLDRWQKEKDGQENVGRVLPKEYRYFEGDGLHNHYATEYGGTDFWDWCLESPYES